jgi:hypothetical protein
MEHTTTTAHSATVVTVTPLDRPYNDPIWGPSIARSGYRIELSCGHSWTMAPHFSPPKIGSAEYCKRSNQ